MKSGNTLSEKIGLVNSFFDRWGAKVEEKGFEDSLVQELAQFICGLVSGPCKPSVEVIFQGKMTHSKKFKASTLQNSASIAFNRFEAGQLVLHYPEKDAEKLLEEDREEKQILLGLIGERIGALAFLMEKDKEVERFKQEALNAYDRTIEAWAAAFETQQKEASGHTERVTMLALALAKEMGFSDEELINVRRGALLHDIGKISIPDEIISKPGKLTEEEFEVVKRSPVFAKKWLSQIELLRPALQIPYYHHEKWNGTGYPLGLSGEDIPLVARMFSIVDVWDALTSDRPYRQALSREEALNLIVSQSGSHFDPNVVESFIRVLSKEKFIDAPHKRSDHHQRLAGPCCPGDVLCLPGASRRVDQRTGRAADVAGCIHRRAGYPFQKYALPAAERCREACHPTV